MIISILLMVVGLLMVYLSIRKFEDWKPVNVIFGLLGGAILTMSGGASIVLPPIISFLKRLFYVE